MVPKLSPKAHKNLTIQYELEGQTVQFGTTRQLANDPRMTQQTLDLEPAGALKSGELP